MAILTVEKERARLNGDKPVADFTGAVRSVDSLFIEEGDEFTFPENYDVYEQSIAGSDNKAQYIFVEIKGEAKKFYPSCLTKSRMPYNEDGTVVANASRVFAKGTANQLYRSVGSVKEGMDLLKGKKVRVTKMITVRTLRPNTTTVMTAGIPQIDFVEEPAAAPAGK